MRSAALPQPSGLCLGEARTGRSEGAESLTRCHRRRDTKGEGLPLHWANARLFLPPSPWATSPRPQGEARHGRMVPRESKTMTETWAAQPGAATSALHRLSDNSDLPMSCDLARHSQVGTGGESNSGTDGTA